MHNGISPWYLRSGV